MEANKSKSDDPLVNASVFSEKRMTLGIPIQMFVILVVLNIFAIILMIKFFSILSVLLFIAFFLITWLPIYQIHKEDPDAWMAWASILFNKSKLLNSFSTKRKVVFINLNSKEIINDEHDKNSYR